MSKKITIAAVTAFNANKSFNKQNMKIEVANEETKMFLHGNLIAYKNKEGLYVSNAGWFSNTTKERLNALDNVSIYQKNWEWFLNSQKWNGQWTKVN